MLFSIVYLVIRGLLRLVPGAEGGREREVEILVLRHQVKVLSRKAGRPNLRRLDRVFLSAAARMLPRERRASFLVTPQRSFVGTGNWSDANGPTEGSPSGARRCPRK